MPAYQQSGEIASAGDLSVDLGYDPARHWEVGDLPADVFTLGDFQSALGAEKLNLDQIAQLSGLDLTGLRIADVPFFQGKSLAEVVEAVPALSSFTLEEIPALAEIIDFDPAATLAEMIDADQLLGDLNFSDLLGDFSIMEIPNLDLTTLDGFKDWQATAISEIPGLGDIGLGTLSQIPNLFSGVTATHDISFGPKEHTKTLTKHSITGSNKDGFSVQCAQPRGCAHIELAGPGGMAGAQWISGGQGEGQQMVNGGEKLLGAVNGGKEPTGRLPFGDIFKVVLDGTNESKGTADFALYFKICFKGTFVDLGCTPYFLGPVPMPVLSSKEKGMVITGFLDGLGGLSSGIQAPKAWEELKPKMPQEVSDLISANTPSRKRVGGGLCGDGPGGVSFESLGTAFSSIEGNYDSVGSWTNGGYGIGRYQYMTYRSDVRNVIGSKLGGAAFLDRADRGYPISRTEVSEFFTEADQDALFKQDQTQNIKQAMSEGFTGSRIIERVGQIHFGGAGAPIDGNFSDVHGRLTLKTYGEELSKVYEEAASQEGSTCKASTPIKPLDTKLTGLIPGQEYGTSRPNRAIPCYGVCHGGQDIDIQEGEEFQAYIGGVVTFRDCEIGGGYYCYIDIYNEELDVVMRVAEAEEILVDVGQTVQAGQVITRGHAPTGVIHLEIRTDVNELGQGGYGIAGTIDPIEYLENLGVLTREGVNLVGVHDAHDHP